MRNQRKNLSPIFITYHLTNQILLNIGIDLHYWVSHLSLTKNKKWQLVFHIIDFPLWFTESLMPASSLLAGSYSCRPQNACQLSELIMNKTSQEKNPVLLKPRPLRSMKAWSILTNSWPRFSAWMRAFPSIEAVQRVRNSCITYLERGGEKKRYNLKEKQWHPLIIKELYPYPHKALPDMLLLSFQSLERTAALISAHTAGQAATAPWRGWDVPKPWRTQHIARWPACHSRATRSFPAAQRQPLPLGCRQWGCAGWRTAGSCHTKRK